MQNPGMFVIYVSNVAPIVFTARLYTIDGAAGIDMQTLLFTNSDLESLRSRIPHGLQRIVVQGVVVPAGNTLVEVWI